MVFKRQEGVPEYACFAFEQKKKDYVLLIPVINEGRRILKELKRAVKYHVADAADIVICDGGSSDGSTQKKRPQRLGVNTIDGNNKDSIEDVPHFIQKLQEGYDFVQGSRFRKGGRAVRTPLIRLLAARLIHAPVISLTAGQRFTDTSNAYRAYSAAYLKDSRVQPLRDIFTGYELLAYLSVRASQTGRKACEIPVSRVYPASGRTPTKISFWKGNASLFAILLKNAAGVYAPGKNAACTERRKWHG